MAYSESQRAAILQRIYDEVAQGKSVGRLLKGTKRKDLCSLAQFWIWHWQDDEVQVQLARAREAGVEVRMDEIVHIADDKTLDPADRRIRIYAREKAAAMLKPRKYGAKLDVTSDGEAVGRGAMDDTAIAIRAASLLMAALGREGVPDKADDADSPED